MAGTTRNASQPTETKWNRSPDSTHTHNARGVLFVETAFWHPLRLVNGQSASTVSAYRRGRSFGWFGQLCMSRWPDGNTPRQQVITLIYLRANLPLDEFRRLFRALETVPFHLGVRTDPEKLPPVSATGLDRAPFHHGGRASPANGYNPLNCGGREDGCSDQPKQASPYHRLRTSRVSNKGVCPCCLVPKTGLSSAHRFTRIGAFAPPWALRNP